MRVCCILSLTVFAWLGVYAAVAKEFSDADLAEARTRQADDIKRLESALNTLEQKKRDAVKRIDRDAVKDLNAQIKDTKLDLSTAKKKTPEQYAAELAAERKLALEKAKEAAQRAREAEQRRKEAAEAAEAELAATLAAKRAAEEQEAERKRLSGGCPLKVISGKFFHVDSEAARVSALSGVLPPDLFGDSTIIVYDLENRDEKPVEAYEILVQFLNGFDEVVQEHIFQGTLIAPKEHRKAVNGVREIKTATQAKIVVKRAKFVDGSMWERLPEHKNTGITIKAPEGAEKIRF